MTLGEMSLEELEQFQKEINAEREVLKARAHDVQMMMDIKFSEAEARRKFAAMSDPEKAALAQLLQARGIESAEAMGTPGT